MKQGFTHELIKRSVVFVRGLQAIHTPYAVNCPYFGTKGPELYMTFILPAMLNQKNKSNEKR